MFWVIVIFLSLWPLIYWYLNRNFNYWSKRGIKGPNPRIGFGNLLDFAITPQPILEVNWLNKYGKIYGYFSGNSPVLTIAEPELIKTVLVKDFNIFPDRRLNPRQHPIISKNLANATGDDWKRLRSIASPTFTSGKMKKMYPLIRECLKDFMSHLESFANERKDINAKELYGNYTMDVIASCAFATKTNTHKEVNNPFVVNAKKAFKISLFRIILNQALPQNVINAFKINRESNETIEGREYILNILRDIIKRRKSGKKLNDFVQLLIDAENATDSVREDNDDNESHHINEGNEEQDIEKKVLNVNFIDKHLTEDEVLAQAIIFLLAGYETTATTLTYSTYELALQPKLQDRLFEEVKSVIDSNGEISYEELAKLPFLDAVLSETLRLHSPAIRLTRRANSNYELGDTGITIFKGQVVDIPIYAIHHFEEFYPDPFKYKPDRFMPENRHLLKPYTYLPFGGGPRNCIGMRFALLEAKLALAHIVMHYKFLRSDATDVPLIPKRVFGLNSPNNVIVGIEKRY